MFSNLLLNSFFIQLAFSFTFTEPSTYYVNRMCAIDTSGRKRFRTDSGYRICPTDACPLAKDDTPCLICCKQCNYDVMPKTIDDGSWDTWTSWTRSCRNGHQYRIRQCVSSTKSRRNENKPLCEMKNKSRGHAEEETRVCRPTHHCKLTNNPLGVALIALCIISIPMCILLIVYICYLKITKAQRRNRCNQKNPADPGQACTKLVTTEKYNNRLINPQDV